MAELGDDPVDEGLRDELGATREVRGPLPDGDVDVGEASLAEDGALDVVGSSLGLLEDDSLGRHADGQKERTFSSPALAQPTAVMAVNPC